MTEKNFIDEVNDLRIEYENARANKVGVEQAKTRYANAMITHGENLIALAKVAEDAEKQRMLLQEEVDALNAALAESDEEIKALKAQNTTEKKKRQRGGE